MAWSREQLRVHMMRKYHERRAAAIAFLGGVCARCGSTEKLEIDHRDPSSKSFALARRTVSDEVFWREIEKCQLLCGPHHREKTVLERGQRIAKGAHGTVSSYLYCRCEQCRAAKSAVDRAYRQRHRSPRGRAPDSYSGR